ncbi:hypothetical protein BDN70DRAFT_841545 [Pholiota conissans]|uniref:F-box domain-containing protein n=1 Tax=Pholiota conissans TaxID=109636 RepID=A0A9P5YSC8_9AGAR|nr:hypothetical protein BDN70DRAFT_841545 [Pholiota conissans]
MSILSLPSTADDVLLDELSAGDLFRLGRTCKTIYATVQDYILRSFQINKLLGRYFTPEEVDHFRRLQATTGMIISGSTALQFLNRVEYPGSDLDAYVVHAFRQEIAKWLLDVGYTYVPRRKHKTFEDDILWEPEEEEYDDIMHSELMETGVGYLAAQCVFTFKKEDPPRKIQMITSLHSPLDRVLNFHSTCVMNVITHDTAYAFFPKGTFDERRAIYCVNTIAHTAGAIEKYIQRGWDINKYITRHEFDDPAFAFSRGLRHVGDAKCWKLPVLPKVAVDQCQRPHGDIESNSWLMKYDRQLQLKMSYCVLNSPRFLGAYLIDPDDEHFNRHLEVEIGERMIPGPDNSSEDFEYLDDEFTSLLNWYRERHYKSDACYLSWPLKIEKVLHQEEETRIPPEIFAMPRR